MSFILDNCGRIFSCDRYRNYNGMDAGRKILEEDFWEIFDSKEFTEPFSKCFGDTVFKNIMPCNRCKYLYQDCTPCYLCVKNTNMNMDQCAMFQHLIEQKRGDKFE